MIYRFFCPCCGQKTEISMNVSEYTAEGHPCPDCGTELKRDPKDFCNSYTVNCDGFYSEHQSS